MLSLLYRIYLIILFNIIFIIKVYFYNYYLQYTLLKKGKWKKKVYFPKDRIFIAATEEPEKKLQKFICAKGLSKKEASNKLFLAKPWAAEFLDLLAWMKTTEKWEENKTLMS